MVYVSLHVCMYVCDDAEYNVAVCPGCTAAMYSAGWPVTATPLDTCGTVRPCDVVWCGAMLCLLRAVDISDVCQMIGETAIKGLERRQSKDRRIGEL